MKRDREACSEGTYRLAQHRTKNPSIKREKFINPFSPISFIISGYDELTP